MRDSHLVIEQRGDPVEHSDQQGVLIAPDGLQFWVSLIMNIKPAQSIYDLHTDTHTQTQSGCYSGLLSLAYIHFKC